MGWALLVKFGEREHLNALRENGVLRFTPQHIFAKWAGGSARGDVFEGADHVAQPKDVRRMTIARKGFGAITLPGDQFLGPIRIGLGGVTRQICCFFAWTDPLCVPTMDHRMCEFGGWFLLILDTQAFLERAQRAAVQKGFDLQCRPITYWDSGYSGPTGPFSKPKRFAYQSEFRLILTPGRKEPIDLECGSMQDITTAVFPASEFNDLIKMAEPSAAP